MFYSVKHSIFIRCSDLFINNKNILHTRNRCNKETMFIIPIKRLFIHFFRNLCKKDGIRTLSTAYPPRKVVKEIRFKRGIISFTGSLNFKGTVPEQLTLPKMLRYLFQQIRNILYKQVNRYQK